MNASIFSSLPQDIFQTIFEKSPGSLLVRANAPHFTIVAVNGSYPDVSPGKKAAVVGKNYCDVFPEDPALDATTSAHTVFTKVVETRKKIDVPNYRFDVYNPDTHAYEIRYWSCSNTPIFGAENEVTFILNTVVDITNEVKAKQAAIENESRLRLATDAASMATWDLGLREHSFISSPRMTEIFGWPEGTALTREELQKQVDTDDMKNIVVPAYRTALLTGHYLYEVKIYWPDSTPRWIRTQGIVIYDEKNIPVRMLGTVIDITTGKSDEIRKNDFIAMASHELKTPLTSIKAYIQILAKRLEPINDDFVNGALQKVVNQVDKMADLIYGFLDLSKLESGKLRLKITTFDINKLIEDVMADSNYASLGRIVKFKPTGEIIVNADIEKIGQVIGNFLSNAFKYSNKESPVTITSSREDSNIKVSVTDRGIGIKLKDQEKLFQRFYRVDSEKMKNISGFGIGLYLSSEIIQRHKGKIGVISKEGRGSTFYFTLPV
ncbi:MAG: PAS domain-containing sensor histidine kinase [Mucilaginibacter sp.]